MTSLKKPEKCSECGHTIFTHPKKPERWICTSCGHIEAERSTRNDPNKCRECGDPRDSKPFKKGSNICRECQSKVHEQYRKDHADRLKQYKKDDYQKNKKQRIASVRKAIQRSPEAFIRNLMHHLTKQSNQARKGKITTYPNRQRALLGVSITFEDLWGLYEERGGRCALSGLPMTHKFGDLCSISVDRIDSDEGYTRGNVQLLCKWVNLAKGKSSNEDFIRVLVGQRGVRCTELLEVHGCELDEVALLVLELGRRVQVRFFLQGWKILVTLLGFHVDVDSARKCSTVVHDGDLVFSMSAEALKNPFFRVPLCDPSAIEKWWGCVEQKLECFIRSGAW